MRLARLASAVALIALWAAPACADDVRVKDLGRFLGSRENALVGYGLVTGLAGSGDSPRSEVTRQAMSNVLGRLGANVPQEQVRSRNVAAVIVTATLPPSVHPGDRIDVTVSSIGDARSLAGGTLLMTPLRGPDQRDYALAQGALVVGGYRFDSELSLQQKNYPSSAILPAGATVETTVTSNLVGPDGDLTFILKDPDVTTSTRIASGINAALGRGAASVRGPDAVSIRTGGEDVYRLIASIENVTVTPDNLARIVVNERSGTVVAGGGVRISSVVVSQGDIKVSVSVDNEASQPSTYGGFVPGARSLVVTNTKLDVATPREDAAVSFPSTTVADLIEGLRMAHVDTRGMISILQAIKAAGALHADIIVQ